MMMTTTEALTRAQALLTECLDHLGIADPEATEIKLAVDLSLRIERFKEVCRVYGVGRLDLGSPPEEALSPAEWLRVITPVTPDDHYDCVLEAGLQAQLALGERDLSRMLLDNEMRLNAEAAGTRKDRQAILLRRYNRAYTAWEEAEGTYRSVVADYEKALANETSSRQSVA